MADMTLDEVMLCIQMLNQQQGNYLETVRKHRDEEYRQLAECLSKLKHLRRNRDDKSKHDKN